jgi:alpha-ketoglutarate-dependent taurine dioxygenase
MSPVAVSPEPSFRVGPLVKTKDQKFNFGAVVTGLDLNDISGKKERENKGDAEKFIPSFSSGRETDLGRNLEYDVAKLKEVIWSEKVVVVKGQKALDPKKHWELVTRFDPTAPQLHSHGNLETFNKKGGMLAKAREVYGIPGAENVRLIGKGYQGPDHYGLKEITVRGLSNDFHADPPDDDEFERGNTRFQRWHIDAPLYERDPAWFTTLRAVKLPSGPDVTIRWDDGSGLEMKSPPGLTAFFSTSQLYQLLTPEEQAMADHSWVEYAPHPYMWIEHCKANPTGLGLKNQGKEHKIEELGEYDESAVKRVRVVRVPASLRESLTENSIPWFG